MTNQLVQGAAAEFYAKKYGGIVSTEFASQLIGTSAVAVLGSDPERVHLVLVNLGTAKMVVHFQDDVSLSNGITLTPEGGSVIMNAEDDGPLITRPFYAIAAGANQSLYIAGSRRFSKQVLGGSGDANS